MGWEQLLVTSDPKNSLTWRCSDEYGLKYKNMRKRIKYSQNFLKSRRLIRDLVEKSSVSKEDIVFEIGAGQGVITQELADYCRKVVAFEIDENLYQKLKEKFKARYGEIDLRLGNFLDYQLPSYGYKVFSNIPFNVTSDIIKKLVLSKSPPLDTYLIVQKEAAEKFAGRPVDDKNSLMSILIKAQFKIEMFHGFKKSDFFPKPNVDTVMLRIKPVKKPLLSADETSLFYDFVTYAYGQFRPNILKGLSRIMDEQRIKQVAKDVGFSISSKPSQLEIEHWTVLFQAFLEQSSEIQKNKVRGSFKKLQTQQSKLQKILRTRTNKTWKQRNFPHDR